MDFVNRFGGSAAVRLFASAAGWRGSCHRARAAGACRPVITGMRPARCCAAFTLLSQCVYAVVAVRLRCCRSAFTLLSACVRAVVAACRIGIRSAWA
ncbi:tetrathionate reductase subunit C [Prevotella dentalis DSM 3688]|uniref:Tetrathionate reductase subunit C n=1 Tax=Prevotella dentalis (strain ATCC 49559 / DSM 3688 / JCM 13448 / NCTC 12043 / ES 2772) TaxID=908937 RepID=F9CZI2_PREDD|nr:tetrathionate reductase subunit C [Prevotella dentalis DSM 3688]